MAFKLRVKTDYIEVIVEDTYICVDNMTRHQVPSVDEVIKIINKVSGDSIAILNEKQKEWNQ